MTNAVKWCSMCSEKPAEGIATVQDTAGNIFQLPLCNKCHSDLVGLEHLSIG